MCRVAPPTVPAPLRMAACTPGGRADMDAWVIMIMTPSSNPSRCVCVGGGSEVCSILPLTVSTGDCTSGRESHLYGMWEW